MPTKPPAPRAGKPARPRSPARTARPSKPVRSTKPSKPASRPVRAPRPTRARGAPPVETPWRSLNSRLDAPAGLQITLFEELETLDERAQRPGFGEAATRDDSA